MTSMAIFNRCRPIIKTLNTDFFIKSITTSSFLSQEAQLATDLPPPTQTTTSLPPNPATGSPLYNENWRSPVPNSPTASLIPLGFLQQPSFYQIESLSQKLDVQSMMNLFADWVTTKRWADMKQLFESWIRSLDNNGKPNIPNVGLYNHYLMANLMLGMSPGELLDLIAQMDDYGIQPNTASFNLLLKSMHRNRDSLAAEKVIERMVLAGKDSSPDDQSYKLVVDLLLSVGDIDSALKYIDMTLKSGNTLSMEVFAECVKKCINKGRLDALVSIIERCKKMEQNKDLCPPWNSCITIAEAAMQTDNSELAFYSLEFMAKWIIRGENARPPVLFSVDEGLVVLALGTANRRCNSKLLSGAWDVLKRSLRKKVPSPASYLAKIYGHASLGDLQKAFMTLMEFENSYKGSTKEAEEDLFSPFTSLYPLVVASSKNGFVTLDAVYYQLENLTRADPPRKSVAALNCIILGCANIWDDERAYQTFQAMEESFGLTPDIHSYNALICAFGKLQKTDEAVKVFQHLISSGLKPNAKSYSLLVDAHLIKRDPKAALSVINEMMIAGFQPSKEILKKVRRRSIREMDYGSDDKVESLAKELNIIMGTENRRGLLFNLEYSTEFA